MTVVQTRFIGHKTETPTRWVSETVSFGRVPLEGTAQPPWQAGCRTKPSSGAIGRVVRMSDKRLRRIIASTPADKTAARVVARGIHYAPPEKLRPQHSVYSGELPPMVNVPRDKRNHTGLVIGDLTVIGYLGDHFDKDGESTHSRWLVRCRCGVYEHRKDTTLGRMAKSGDLWSARCWECTNLARLRGQKPTSDQWQDRPLATVPLLPGANDAFGGGEKFGRLTVIGYGGSGGNGGRWVVRCDCGQYGRMTSAGLKRGKSPQCERCYRVEMAGGQP